jgi:hypothetical protein
MPTQFWVIGGEYADERFNQLVEGAGRALGPYASYEEAEGVWRDQTGRSRHEAFTRFTIVSCAPNPRRERRAA